MRFRTVPEQGDVALVIGKRNFQLAVVPPSAALAEILQVVGYCREAEAKKSMRSWGRFKGYRDPKQTEESARYLSINLHGLAPDAATMAAIAERAAGVIRDWATVKPRAKHILQSRVNTLLAEDIPAEKRITPRPEVIRSFPS